MGLRIRRVTQIKSKLLFASLAIMAIAVQPMYGFVASQVANAASAVTVSNVDAYYSSGTDHLGSEYTGVGVDFTLSGIQSTDIESVQLQLDRTSSSTPYAVLATDTLIDEINNSTDPEYTTTGTVVVTGSRTSSSNSWETMSGTWTGTDDRPTTATVTVTLADNTTVTGLDDSIVDNNGNSAGTVFANLPTVTDIAAITHDDTKYAGIYVETKSSGFTNAKEVSVTIKRADDSEVTKTSRLDTNGQPSVDAMNNGVVGTPFIIQDRTYNENNGHSWSPATGDTSWTTATKPTSVTVKVTLIDDSTVTETSAINISDSAYKALLPIPAKTIHVASYYSDADCNISAAVTKCKTLQGAMDIARNGDTVLVHSNLSLQNTVNVDRSVTIDGDNSTLWGESGVAGKPMLNVTSDGVTIQNVTLRGKNNAQSGIKASGDNLMLSGVTVNDATNGTGYGIDLKKPNGTIKNVKITNSHFDNNIAGLKVDSKTSVQGLTVSNSSFNNNEKKGWYVPAAGSTTFDAVEVTDTSFTNSLHNNYTAAQYSYYSAIYAEKLSSAAFDGVTFSMPTNKRGTGINLNGSNGNVNSITIKNSTFSTFNRAFKLNGGTISNLDINHNNFVKNNQGLVFDSASETTLDKVIVTQNNILDNSNTGLSNNTGSSIDTKNNWWGDDRGPQGNTALPHHSVKQWLCQPFEQGSKHSDVNRSCDYTPRIESVSPGKGGFISGNKQKVYVNLESGSPAILGGFLMLNKLPEDGSSPSNTLASKGGTRVNYPLQEDTSNGKWYALVDTTEMTDGDKYLFKVEAHGTQTPWGYYGNTSSWASKSSYFTVDNTAPQVKSVELDTINRSENTTSAALNKTTDGRLKLTIKTDEEISVEDSRPVLDNSANGVHISTKFVKEGDKTYVAYFDLNHDDLKDKVTDSVRVYFRLYDTHGNISPVNYYYAKNGSVTSKGSEVYKFEIDNIAPSIPEISPADGASIKGIQKFKIASDEEVTADSDEGELVPNGGGTWTLDTTEMNRDTKVTITAIAEDEAGNTAKSTATFTVENNLPVLSDITSNVNDGFAVVSGEVSSNAKTVTVNFESKDYPAHVNPNGTWFTDGINVKNKTVGNNYPYTVTADAGYGNETTSDKWFITIPEVKGYASIPDLTTQLGVPTQDGSQGQATDARTIFDDAALALNPATEGGSTLGTSTTNSEVKGAADDKSSPASFFGLAWYWWVLIVAALLAAIWWIAAAARKKQDA